MKLNLGNYTLYLDNKRQFGDVVIENSRGKTVTTSKKALEKEIARMFRDRKARKWDDAACEGFTSESA